MHEDSKRILDVGGWFKPEPRATHVIDLMPWETRGAKLQLERLPAEQFSKETWYQADFLAPDLRIPFEDNSFDLVLCKQTVEDLASPNGLLLEMIRVGKAGLIECPSRMHEQTVGVRDRMSVHPGHPHHNWIVESERECLVLYSKADSRLDRKDTTIPLSVYERMVREMPGSETWQFTWRDAFRIEIIRGERCLQRARDASSQAGFSPIERLSDAALRALRRARAFAKGAPGEDFSWWHEIVRQSEPFSSIKLR